MIKRAVLVLICVTFALSDVSACPPFRDRHQRAAFMQKHPCPATGKTYGACFGWVVDHIIPLACGGKDRPTNMQWQTLAEAKAKDVWEAKDCKR